MTSSRLVADLHLHSRYSLATSPALDLQLLAESAVLKGIDLLSAPDFTHPVWRSEMLRELEPVADGVFRLKARHGSGTGRAEDAGSGRLTNPSFILVTEISCVWRQGDRSRRVHVMVMAPSFAAVDSISSCLGKYQDLESDGRPVIKLSADSLYEMVLEADERCVLFPAHVWTPWYGMYGSKSGFDSIAECFPVHARLVPAVETGLSSTPAMNWSVGDIGGRSIISFSDAHSAGSMGRELTILNAIPEYDSVRSALFENRVVETIEFHPEHGKYHMNGHRKCGTRLEPAQTPPGARCPECGRPLTLGVLHRIGELSDRPQPVTTLSNGLVTSTGPGTRPFRQLVPLRQLVSQALSRGENSVAVRNATGSLRAALGNELHVLAVAGFDEIATAAGEQVANRIIAVREGRIAVDPGYDGKYGTVTALS